MDILSTPPHPKWPQTLKEAVVIPGHEMGFDVGESKDAPKTEVSPKADKKEKSHQQLYHKADLIDELILEIAHGTRSPSEHEEPMERPLEKVLLKSPLGVSIDGDETHGIFVTTTKRGGNAALSGVVKEGMKIISINGQKVEGMSKKGVVALVSQNGEHHLVLQYSVVEYCTFLDNKGVVMENEKLVENMDNTSIKPTEVTEESSILPEGSSTIEAEETSSVSQLHGEILSHASDLRDRRAQESIRSRRLNLSQSTSISNIGPPIDVQDSSLPPGWRSAVDPLGRVRE